MTSEAIADWLNQTLNVKAFADDVSNNGMQIARDDAADGVRTVAVAVDASVRAVRAAVAAGAQMLVVHHGISWGGGLRRITGGTYAVVKTAMDANMALYACHLPLDAHPTLGNNAQLARHFKLSETQPAFSWRGHEIGVIGRLPNGEKMGICSGGAGDFAVEAKALGCDVYYTGEADWGERIAAENAGMKMICAGHYETETFGVRALGEAMREALRLEVVDLTERLRPTREERE